MTRKILIDTDPGVDDAMAILMALASPQLDVVGVTTIFGNADTATTTRNALALLEIADRSDIPVAAGCAEPLAAAYLGPVPQVHGHNGLGEAPLPSPSGSAIDQSGPDFIKATVSADPGTVTVVALGPLTNLAKALTDHPDVVDHVAEVVVMGGNALVPGNATPVAEANINNDPEAADLVFGAGWEVTMVGLDVTHQVNLGGAAIERIFASDGVGARFLSNALPLYRDFFETTNGIDGIFVHDPSVMAYLIDGEAFGINRWPIRVETESFSRGKTWPNLGDTDDAQPPPWQGRPLVNVCTSVDGPRVAALVERHLAGQP